jgi:hypothetical protein
MALSVPAFPDIAPHPEVVVYAPAVTMLGRAAARRSVRGAAALLAASLCLTGCGLLGGSSGAGSADSRDSSDYQPTKADFGQIRSLLARRSSALAHHREARFMATVDHGDGSFVHRQQTLYQNLVRLGVTSVSYDADTSSLLVPADIPGGDPVLRPDVTEQVKIAATTHPITDPVEDTFVKRDGHWLLGAETSSTDESSFDAPQEQPWSGVPIAVRTAGPLTVMMDEATAGRLATLTATIHSDITHDASLLGIPPQYAVLVDATTNGIGHAMNGNSSEDAAAVTKGLYYEPHGDSSRARLAGTLIKINPQSVTQVLSEPSILRHELTHYLLREYNGSSPRWLVEGVAAWVQYYPDDFSGLQIPAGLYSTLMHADRRLPPDGVFYDYPDVDYPIGQAAVAWLVSHYGMAKLLALMKAYRDEYRGANIDSLTPKVLRQVDGVAQAQVVAGAFGLLASFRH